MTDGVDCHDHLLLGSVLEQPDYQELVPVSALHASDQELGVQGQEYWRLWLLGIQGLVSGPSGDHGLVPGTDLWLPDPESPPQPPLVGQILSHPPCRPTWSYRHWQQWGRGQHVLAGHHWL